MKIAFLHTPNFFTSELLKRFRAALSQHEVVEWIGGKDAPVFDFEVLLAMGYVGRTLLQSQPKLKFIQTASDGYEEVDIEAASEAPRTSTCTQLAERHRNMAACPAELPPPTITGREARSGRSRFSTLA